MNRFIIAGTGSSCGKTTITCAVLSALKKRNTDLSSFKCGPDYIDTMFHKSVLGIPSHNLDSFFCDDDMLCFLLEEYGADTVVIEGVMGFYDAGIYSVHSLSNKTDTPVVMVIDCKGMSDSVGAVMQGFLNYKKPNNIIGFIFNRLPKQLIPNVKKMCDDLNTCYFGSFPKMGFTFDSRHLGLVTADESDKLNEKLEVLGQTAEKNIEIDKLLSIRASSRREYSAPKIVPVKDAPTISVAKDKAFCFIYEENIDLLKKFGCKIKFFSPLNDEKVPECDGLYLCGGYPELYAQKLSSNVSMIKDIRDRIERGTPAIAECGGFLYLHETLADIHGDKFPMCGIIKGNAFNNQKLTRFGYVALISERSNMLAGKNESIKAHEFHYYESENCGNDFTAEKLNGKKWDCIHANDHLYAGFPHIYFYSDIGIAERFIKKCIYHGDKNGKDQNYLSK